MTTEYDQIPEQALRWLDEGKDAALATVWETWGSAPRRVGAQLAISSESELQGSVSGGCVEAAVAAEALEAMRDGAPRVLSFGVSDDDAFAAGLACGGEIRVAVEPVGVGRGPGRDEIRALAAARAGRRAVVLAVDPESWSRRLIGADETGAFGAAAREALAADASGFAQIAGRAWFLAVHNPPLRLAIVGASHIAQALAPMAAQLGYDCLVIDPRAAFATRARFPGARLSGDWPDIALKAFAPDARTAVATLSHDPKIDDPALIAALDSPAFYVGALGSTRTHARRVVRLREAGLAQADIARIDAPIGLDIGASSPSEIALSALAALTARLRRPGASR